MAAKKIVIKKKSLHSDTPAVPAPVESVPVDPPAAAAPERGNPEAPPSATPPVPVGAEKPPHRTMEMAQFKFFCYRCGQKLKVSVAWANAHHACPNCGSEILVPEPTGDDYV